MAQPEPKKSPPSRLQKGLPPVKVPQSWSPRRIIIWLFVGLLFVPLLFNIFFAADQNSIPLSQLLNDIRSEQIRRVEVTGAEVKMIYEDGTEKNSLMEPGQDLVQLLNTVGVDPTAIEIEVQDMSASGMIWDVLINVLPLLLMVGFFLFLFRQARGSQGDMMGFGKSKAKFFVKGKQDVKFADVGGMQEAKQELEEIVDFLKNPEKYKKVGARTPKGALLVGPAGTGKCVTGDTTVWTNKGLMEIQEIPRYYFVDPTSHQVYGAGLDSFDVKKVASQEAFASHWYDLGEQETISLQLGQGFDIEGTPEHPVVVMDETGTLQFRRLDAIKEGDAVALQYGQERFGSLDLVDKDTAYLMGILTGDGNLSHSSRIGLTSIDEEIVTFFKKYVEERYPQSRITPNGQSYLVASWDFKRFLYQVGMSYLLSFDKIVPPTILQAPREIQVSFLQGLFDADGSVETKRAAFEYTTVSKKMARQVQMMLLNLGVVASLNIKGRTEKGYYRSVYRITLTGSAFVAFAKKVNFRLTRKKQLVQVHVQKMTRVNTNIDLIPGISELVQRSWKTLSLQHLSTEKLSKTIDKVRRRGRISRETLREYVAQARELAITVPSLEYFEQLISENLFFVPVMSKKLGYQRVYDFTVPGTHSFLGNGLINHNTLLARAVAGEAGVPYLSIAGSEFMEMLVGVGAARARDLFETAKKMSPAIIFIDEIDAIGRMRGHGGGMGGHDEREQTLNQILVEMDGFSPNDNVIVLAATNRGDMLDPALTRPGRFDRRITLTLPDIEERMRILKIHAANKPVAKEVNWQSIGKRTVGFSGADLENMLNEAAILIARESRTEINNKDMEEAALKVKLGPSKKRLQSERERRMTAYHEAGHAIVAHFLPDADRVHRISIVSRGMALGFTLTPPEQDKYQQTKSELLATMAVLLGGRAAEDIFFDELTGGASNDIEKVTNIARAMVLDYGMSKLGPLNFGPQYDSSTYARAAGETHQVSDRVQAEVDAEMQRMVAEAEAITRKLIIKYRKAMDKVVERLMDVETLEAEEFEAVVGHKKVVRDVDGKVKTE